MFLFNQTHAGPLLTKFKISQTFSLEFIVEAVCIPYLDIFCFCESNELATVRYMN